MSDIKATPKPRTKEVQLVKPPHLSSNYTAAQLVEFAKCADPINGLYYFMSHYFYIQHPTKGRLLYTPFPYQIELAKCYHSNRFSIHMLARQLGKCVCANINISIKNKQGIIYDIPIGKFYEYESAKRNKTELPDISQYQRKDVQTL